MTTNCTNCGLPSAEEYCPNCDQFRERLEQLRQEQRERRRNPKPSKRPRKQAGAWFMDQCKRHGEKLLAARVAGEQLPMSGQDAALPVGDRE